MAVLRKIFSSLRNNEASEPFVRVSLDSQPLYVLIYVVERKRAVILPLFLILALPNRSHAYIASKPKTLSSRYSFVCQLPNTNSALPRKT